MITSEEQLTVVRQQLRIAEEALDSLHREVRPQNPKLYEAMSESYVGMILQLRGEIDAYREVLAPAALVISLQGNGVGLGQTSAAVVSRYIDTFRRGLQFAVELVGTENRTEVARRRERWIEAICDLPIAGVGPGSLSILLGEHPTDERFSAAERQTFAGAVDLLFDGIRWAGDVPPDDSQSDGDDAARENSSPPFPKLDADRRQAMLSLLARLLPPRSGDIERVAFQRRLANGAISPPGAAMLTRSSRARIHTALRALLIERQLVQSEGLIRSVDLDAQTFVLRERSENLPDLLCEYGSELEDVVKQYLDCRVLVSGSLETSRKTARSRLSVDVVEAAAKDGDAATDDVAG